MFSPNYCFGYISNLCVIVFVCMWVFFYPSSYCSQLKISMTPSKAGFAHTRVAEEKRLVVELRICKNHFARNNTVSSANTSQVLLLFTHLSLSICWLQGNASLLTCIIKDQRTLSKLIQSTLKTKTFICLLKRRMIDFYISFKIMLKPSLQSFRHK